MNGYDFDKTIMHGNSTRRFCMYCSVRLPYLWLLMPWYLVAVILYGLHIIRKDAFLYMLEVFVLFVPNRQKFVERFWDKNIKHIRKWYLDARRDDDVVVSASPQYLIQSICNRLGVACIASPTNANYKSVGKHCYGKVKVQMYRERYGEAPLATYYSDSMSDVPMFELAQRGYLVKGDKISLVYEGGTPVKAKA